MSGNKDPEAGGIRKGRFESGMDPLFARFNASVSFDSRLYAQDIRGSVAHARMLARQGIISDEEAQAIVKGLAAVLDDIERGDFQFDDELEDVHINIEAALKAKIGDVAGKLHTARSRNDQVVLDLRLYLKDRTVEVKEALRELMAALVGQAEAGLDVILPGYTHLRRAQPVRLAHHLMAYFEMFRRDWLRFQDSEQRLDVMPLGSAALAGTTFDVDRPYVAEQLGFSAVSTNSMDAVSDRDFVVEFIFDAALVMTHLSRLTEELILWSSEEFAFCALPDAFCSGSSIMPQKKNPDACELVRGKTGRVYGHLISLLTTLKALPLAYNKDLQEDKEPLFDCVDTALACVRIMARQIPGIRFDAEKMRDAAMDPSLAATDLADRMTREGVPFRQAHERIGAIVREGIAASDRGGKIADLPTVDEMVEARKQTGGTALSEVSRQIAAAREFLEAAREFLEAAGKEGTEKV